MKVIIIGSGPAGISAGYELVKHNVKVEIFEASGFVGGLARSIELWDQRVDLGPHRFFSKEKRVNTFFNEVLKEDYTVVNRLTRIYYKDHFFHYPLKIRNVLANLSFLEVLKILSDYFYQKLFPIKSPETFEEWITNRFGKRLFEIFFKNYSEKLWGVPCSKIDADWAAQRIKSLSLWQAIYSAIKGNKANKYTSLVDQFAYPINGTGTLYERAAKFIVENGGEVHLNSPVKKVILDENGNASGVELFNHRVIEANMIISTMPINNLISGLQNAPMKVIDASKKLSFRNTILVYLEIDAVDLFTDNWIYVHSSEVRHGRITNFRNWCPSLYGDAQTSIVCMEFWAFDSDDLWGSDDEKLKDLAKREIRQLKLITEDHKILNAHVIKIKKCYPVYEIGYKERLKTIRNYLNTIQNLIPIGRYGAFKYNNQDHSILMGLLTAEKIIKNKPINLWAINTDTEYQEDGEIKDVLIQ